MRRIVSTVTLSTFFFLSSLAATSASSRDTLFDTVNATMDSSGVSITINQSSVSLDGDTSANTSITVSSSSTDTTLVCELDHQAHMEHGHITVGSGRTYEVTWNANVDTHLTLSVPSIGVASILSQFDCEPVDGE